jgi:hypothetical protein
VAQDVYRIVQTFNKGVARLTANGQRVGRGTGGGIWNQFRADYDMLTKGTQTTNRILGCEDQCNQLTGDFINLKTNNGYTFQNVVSYNPLRHVRILATPAFGSGAPSILLDPLYNSVKVGW